MASIIAETGQASAAVAKDKPDGQQSGQQSGEQPAAEHMRGWALTSLTVAFMAICFVLALDNTILGWTSAFISSDYTYGLPS